MTPVPFVIGQWVRGERFYGRERLLAEVLDGPRNGLWLLGTRRIGKTSLQHQLKRRLQQLDDPDYTFYPVYIDLQGTPETQFFATLAEDVFHELEPLLGGLQPGEGLEAGVTLGEARAGLPSAQSS